MQGKIIKGIGGFYYVYTEQGVLECKAKGIFRRQNIKPLVGDNVEVEILSEQTLLGNINSVLPRTNQLIRPAVANVDQAMVVFSVTEPSPNLNLLDRFLIMMECQGVQTVIVFSKKDMKESAETDRLVSIYERCGYSVLAISSAMRDGIEGVKKMMAGKTTVLAGPSGVGKSSLVNELYPKANMETGEISIKLGRGRHTTRHTELFCIGENTFLMDTPGFSSLQIPELEKEELRFYFREFEPYEGKCRFQGCIHENEPSCQVKAAVEQGKIGDTRYQNYTQMLIELSERKKY